MFFSANRIDKPKALSLLLHTADISHPSKPWALHSRWTQALMEEFFRQVGTVGDHSPLLSSPLFSSILFCCIVLYSIVFSSFISHLLGFVLCNVFCYLLISSSLFTYLLIFSVLFCSPLFLSSLIYNIISEERKRKVDIKYK